MRIAAAVVAASLATVAPGWAQEPIKIGYSGALSGPASFTGSTSSAAPRWRSTRSTPRAGSRAASSCWSRATTSTTRSSTVAQYRELVERESVVAMLGATNSASMLAVTPIVNETLKVPVICPATDATAITENDAAKAGQDNYLFRIGMYGTGQANFITDTMVKRFGHTKVGSPQLDRRLGRHRPHRAAAPPQGDTGSRP